MKVTARAHTNIALIKYWGKRDETLFLPMNSSLSLTLDQFYTTTTVQFCTHLYTDIFLLNGHLADESESSKVTKFLNRIRELSGRHLSAIVESQNHVPTAAGFASSAAGFAALAAAAVKAIGLKTDMSGLSQIARQGSGSACRSVYGGFVEWQKGEKDDGTDSFAIPFPEGDGWNISILSVLVNPKPKKVSSREGMKLVVETSPFYSNWVAEAEKDLLTMKKAIRQRDFEMLGRTAEANALKMHATTLGANPPFTYWESGTLEVIRQVQALRLSGIQAFFTIDAGPNVKVLVQPADEQAVRKELLSLPAVKKVFICHPGPGVTYLSHE
jgi:diphosphomevalonate decarboxylase